MTSFLSAASNDYKYAENSLTVQTEIAVTVCVLSCDYRDSNLGT